MDRPTEEQLRAVEAFRTHQPLKISAFAGAGKTTTLRLLAESRSAKGSYLAFNKSIAAEAKEKFPRSVDCRTTHSIAFREVMPRFQSPAKMTKNLLPKQLAGVAGYRDQNYPGALRLTPVQQAYLVLGTLKQFCQSADPALGVLHVPTYGRLLGAQPEVIAAVRAWAASEATRIWAEMADPKSHVPLGHDGYLKLWALGRPNLGAEYILLDEAQDTNEVVLGVLQAQKAQIVYVGDRHQQIYEWRGAVNAMEKISGCTEVALTQSFRFGDQIADMASRVIATLGETSRIRGNSRVSSSIRSTGREDTVLCRTNATVILEILDAGNRGQNPYVVGGTSEIKRLLSDVYDLKAGKAGVSPEFFGFQRWGEVVDFASSEEGEAIRAFVQLVEQHGEGKLWAAVKGAADEEEGADIVISTAHKAKGREWDSVRLTEDFGGSQSEKKPIAAPEVRLFYVAMTRAKTNLIVSPETLALFTTDAWKSPAPAGKSRPQARTAPPVNDRPAAARLPRDAPTPASARARARTIVEVNAKDVRQRHPSATQAPVPSPQVKPKGFWGSVAKLFGLAD